VDTFYNIILDSAGTLSGTFSNASTVTAVGGTEVAQLSTGGYNFNVIYNSDGSLDTTAGNDVTVEFLGAVPEPGTWAMLLSGAGMLVVWQRGRRRRS